MSAKHFNMQEFLLNHDPVYRDNYKAVLRSNPNGLNGMWDTMKWLFNSAKRRAHRAGLIDDQGRPRV